MRRYDHVINTMLPSLLLWGWECRTHAEKPSPGDLVMLQSAPESDWTLSFYREAGAGHGCGQKHLLESLKTGGLCWWENVGFHVINREKVGLGAMAEWSDAQFGFSDRFRRVRRRGDFHLALPYIDRFDGDSVLIGFRTRWSMDDNRTALAPLPWRKINQRDLLAALRAGEAAHKGKPS